MSDIFREVEEEVRREKAAQVWDKYQNLIIGLALVVVVAAGGWRYWQYHTRTAAEAAGLQFQEAIGLASEGKEKDAQQAFEKIAKTGPTGYAMLAKLRAAADIAAKDKGDAVKAYDAIAADSSIAPFLQEAARIRAAMLAVDSASFEDMKKRLEPLAGSQGTFRYTAIELLALSAIKANDFKAATKWLDQLIAAPNAPASIRSRANAMQGMVAGSGSGK